MKRITLRIPDDVYDRLKESQKGHQSLNNMIVEALEKSLPDPAILAGKTQIDIERLK